MATATFSISSLSVHKITTNSSTKFSIKCMNKPQEVKETACSSLYSNRRGIIATSLGTALSFSLSRYSQAAILEADDDLELLEKVKKDREKRLQRQVVISSSKKETGYLQELVYKLSKVGQAIENNDFSSAGSVLARSSDADWLQNVNVAFTKLSSSPEETVAVDTFNSSLASLISSVDKQEIKTSKSAFVSSASAFENWAELTGLNGLLKGL